MGNIITCLAKLSVETMNERESIEEKLGMRTLRFYPGNGKDDKKRGYIQLMEKNGPRKLVASPAIRLSGYQPLPT